MENAAGNDCRVFAAGGRAGGRQGWEGAAEAAHPPGGGAHDVAVGGDGGADHRLQGDGVQAAGEGVAAVLLLRAPVPPAPGAVPLRPPQRRPPAAPTLNASLLITIHRRS